MEKKVFIASSNHWSSPITVGTHHFAKFFLRNGWKVGFVSDPVSPFHLLNGLTPELKDRFSIWKSGGISHENLWTYVPFSIFTPHNKPLLDSSSIQNNWHKLTIPNVKKKIAKEKFSKVDLLYFDSAQQSFWLDYVDHKKSIFRIADMNSGFNKHTTALQEREKKLAQKVDLVLYTARNLEPYVRSLKPKEMMYFPNGVDYNHFATIENPSVPGDMKSINKPIVMYVGAINVWFDFELMNYLAEKLPEVSFVFIGPSQLAETKLNKLSNIHLLGSKKYDEIPYYLHNADIGIIPFNVKGYSELLDYVNPLKLYEYLACGLPSISSSWAELRTIGSPAILCEEKDEFIDGIRKILGHSGDKKNYQSYARKQDWGERFRQLLYLTI
ncbi:MAG: glycosyltransferase [Syntrophothermus sp.]